MNTRFTLYWTEDLKSLTVFGIIEQEVKQRPEMLSFIKLFLRSLEEKIEDEK